MRRLASGVCALAVLALAQTPLPAQADTYRYWSYWTGGDQWEYSARGPGFRVPSDGAVEGWRFVVSPKDGSQAVPPGTASNYDQLCPGQPAAPSGQKRVAVVLDYGPAGIAPVGQEPPSLSVSCVSVPATDNGLQVVQRVATLRFHSSGLICGINGFPASECPGQSTTNPKPVATVATPSAPPRETAPQPADVVPPVTQPRRRDDAPTPAPTPTPNPANPSDLPSPVALALPDAPSSGSPAAPPAWIAAIGVTMIAALLGLAILVRRGRG